MYISVVFRNTLLSVIKIRADKYEMCSPDRKYLQYYRIGFLICTLHGLQILNGLDIQKRKAFVGTFTL